MANGDKPGLFKRALGTLVAFDEEPVEEDAPATPSAAIVQPLRSAGAPDLSVTTWPQERIFREAGVTGTLVPKVQRIMVGLAAVPEPQRLVALRALIGADGSWTEQDVLREAAARTQALRAYVSLVGDRQKAAVAEAVGAQQVRVEGAKKLAERLDAEIQRFLTNRDAALAEVQSASAAGEAAVQRIQQDHAAAQASAETTIAELGALQGLFVG